MIVDTTSNKKLILHFDITIPYDYDFYFHEEGTNNFYYKMKENLITSNAHFRAIFGILQIVVSRDKF